MTPEELSAEETAYFDSRGAKELPGEAAPAIEPEPKPEPAPEPAKADDAEEQGAEEPKRVPLKALQEAREEAKRLKERLEAREADFNKLNGRLDVLQQIAQKPADPAPTWDDQPIDAGKALAQNVVQINQRLAAEDQARQIQNFVVADEAKFREANPDYNVAVDHLAKARAKELAHFGVPQEQIHQQIAMEAQQLAVMALQQGKSPAEIAYNLARERGYQKAEAKPEPVKPDPAKQLETIERGQKAAVSAAAAAGSPQPKNTLEAIMDMDDAEFAKLAEGDWKKLWA